MKFGKRLGDEATAEWATKYINYKYLKKLISAFPIRAKEKVDNHEKIQEDMDISPEEKRFLSALTIEVDKAETFFFDQLKEQRIRKEEILKQLDVLNRMERQEESEGKNDPTDGEFNAGSKIGFKGVSLSATKLLRRYSSRVMSTSAMPLEAIPEDSSAKNNEESEYPIERAAPAFSLHMKPHSSFQMKSSSSILKSAILQHAVKNTVAVAKSNIRTAVIEVYRSLELLKEFRDLNILAYQKIVKKFEKHSQRGLKDRLIQEFMMTPFYRSTEISSFFQQIEDLFQLYFTKNNRQQAMQILRSLGFEAEQAKENATANLFVGLFSGINLMLLINDLQLAIHPIAHREIPGLILLYFGFGLPLLIANLVILNLYVWDAYKVNYRLIFGVNPLTSTSQYGVFVSLLFLVYLTYVNLSLSGTLMSILSPVAQVWVCLALILFIAMNGFNYYRPSRIWMGIEILRILASPFSPCLFKDFFIADQLVSMAPFYQSIALLLTASFSSSASDVLTTHSMSFTWLMAVLPMIPYYWRIMQCIRRYRDGLKRKAGPIQLINGCRYSISILAMIAAAMQQFYVANPEIERVFVYLTMGLKLAYACFSYYWDIYMDWGLGHGRMNAPSHVFDTQEEERMMIAYPFWVYYVGIVLDCFGRFVWLPVFLFSLYHVASSSPLENGYFYALNLIELLRRFQWNFIRVEIEHVHNCEKYQVTQEVDMPFQTQDLFVAPTPPSTKEEAVQSSESSPRNRLESDEKDTEAAMESHSHRSLPSTTLWDRVMSFEENDQ